MRSHRISLKETAIYEREKRRDEAVECAYGVLPSSPESMADHGKELELRKDIERSLRESGFAKRRAWLYAKVVVQEGGELLQTFLEQKGFPEYILETMEDLLPGLLHSRSLKAVRALRCRMKSITLAVGR